MEDSLRMVGEYGTYQTNIKLILLGCAFLTNIYSIQIDIMLHFPNFIISQNNITIQNLTNEFDKKYCDKTKYKIDINENTEIKNWNYNFGFFCEKEYYLYCIYFSIVIGNIFGLIFFSFIADKIGREKVIKFSMIFSCILHLNLLFCLNAFHLLLINLLGSLNSFIFVTSIICITELLPHESNGINIGIFNLVYYLYPIILYLFLKIFSDWKTYFFFTSISHIFIAHFAFYNFLESPRWLYSIGQKIKCLSILDGIALYNGTSIRWNDYQKINIEDANRFGRASTNFTKLFNFELTSGDAEPDFKGINIFDIFKFKSQKNILLLLLVLVFFNSIFSNGIFLLIKYKQNFNSFFLFENIHTLILINLYRIIIGMFSGYFCDILGRKYIIIFGSILGSICFFIYSQKNSEFFLMISFFCSQGINTILLIYIPENISTPIRNTLCGWYFLEYKIIQIFMEISFKSMNQEGLNYIIILSGLLIAFWLIYLKETLNEKIPDIIPELKDKIESLENVNLKSFQSSEYPSFLI